MYGDVEGTEWLDMPAGVAYRLKVLHNVFRAYRGYLNAAAQTNTNEWIRRNPQQWDVVSGIIADKKGITVAHGDPEMRDRLHYANNGRD